MPRSQSTIHPEGALARAIETLERLDCRAEVSEIQRLLVERLRYREEAAALRAELALRREEVRQTSEHAREVCKVARQCLQSWRNLALIQKSRQELDRIDETLARYPYLRAA